MNNKFNNMLNEFLKNNDAKDEQGLEENLQEFIAKYNSGDIEYVNTPLDDAYEILEKAENTKSKKQALKLAREAYEKCNACFDAILFQANLEDNRLRRDEILDSGLEAEKNRLIKEKYFEKDNIGHFYGLFETRPYIRGLSTKAYYLAMEGKMKQSRDICLEILRLNQNDNTGSRYLLMAIYAVLEDEKSALNLLKKYNEENLEMLFPLFVIYYKLGNKSKADEYLSRINVANPHLLKLFKGTMKEDSDALDGYYRRGGSSEVKMYFENYMFLIMNVPNIIDYVLENSKSKKVSNNK